MLAAASQPTVAASFPGASSSPMSPVVQPVTGKRTHLHGEDSVAATAGAAAATTTAAAAVPRKPRALGGFLDDDSDDDNDEGAPADETAKDAAGSPPPAKKRMLEQPGSGGHNEEASCLEPATEDSGFFSQANAEETLPDAQILPEEPQLQQQLQDTYNGASQVDLTDQAAADEAEEDRYDLLFGAARESMLLESETRSLNIQTCSGRSIPVRQRRTRAAVPYEAMVAARSRTKEGRAQKSFYGIDIHALVDGAQKELAEKRRAEKEKEQHKEQQQEASTAEVRPDQPVQSVEDHHHHHQHGKGKKTTTKRKKAASMLWTEKYRARTFLDLVGDDLTNRLVLRWLKRWDPLVFPHAARARQLDAAIRRRQQQSTTGGVNNHNGGQPGDAADEKPHRKILILAGPPGLGKTTLAHVCARQAGYEVLEINASDDRSRDVVQGRIRTSLGTENVKTVEQAVAKAAPEVAAKSASASTLVSKAKAAEEKPRPVKVARPVCVVVDEVDGVVGGSGASGEGGFVKALIDLVVLDQKNSAAAARAPESGSGNNRRTKKKGDDFRQMRPLILICNDVYHPSLRPLRQSGLAEVVHVGKPSVDAVVTRLKTIFEKEGIPCEKEAARKLCEAAWGMSSGPQASRRGGAESTAEGDLRGVMVVGEWVARRLRATTAAAAKAAGSPPSPPAPQLTRFWVDQHVLPDLAYGAGEGTGGVGARGLGRGGVREIVTRIFQEGAGFPKPAAAVVKSDVSSSAAAASSSKAYRHEQPRAQLGFAEHQQRYALARLREMIETSGDVDRIVSDVFAEWPTREFNDDAYLSKPDQAYEWLHFHDACSRRVFGAQEWELAPYTSQPALACHQLFATARRHVPMPEGGGEENGGGGGAAAPEMPFTGPRADFAAREAEKHHRAALQAIQAKLPASLLRAFRSPEDVAAEFLPYAVRLVSPDVKPVLVHVGGGGGGGASGASGNTAVASVRREGEKALVRRAAAVLAELGVQLQRGVLEDGSQNSAAGRQAQWVYRMEPDLDMLASFETAGNLLLSGSAAPTRYAVRQVLDQELRKTLAQRDNAARQARFLAGRPLGAAATSVGGGGGLILPNDADKENQSGGAGKNKAAVDSQEEDVAVKRDFFGRVIAAAPRPLQEGDGNAVRPGTASRRKHGSADESPGAGVSVWVTYHEGLNNAVRKPISIDDFLRGL